MRIKNKDIAKRLNISTSAVSLAINNKPGVSEETRQRVLALLNEESAADAQAAFYRNKLPILFVIHKKNGKIIVDNRFFSNMLTSIQLESAANGYPLQVEHLLPGQDFNAFFDNLNANSYSGIILLATELNDNDIRRYKSLGKPIVAVAAQFITEDIDYVSMDNHNALFKSVLYAYHHGHRNIGYLQSEVRVTSFHTRYDGFLRAMRAFDLPEATAVYSLPPTIDGAHHCMQNLLQQKSVRETLPTIFVCEMDSLAIGAMMAFREAGYRIPADISFIGHDDIPECAVFDPPLTTFSVSNNGIGTLAVQRLIHLIGGTDHFYAHTTISPVLKERASVATLVPSLQTNQEGLMHSTNY